MWGVTPSNHVIPLDDYKPHVESAGCWCMPDKDDEVDDLLIHHNMDGREDFENGTRLPS